MIGKVDVRAILKDHYHTLVDENTNKQSGLDFILFYIVPILVAAALISFDLIFGKTMSGVLITALAIFAGLLFNLLLLIFDVANKPRPKGEELPPNKLRYLKEIYSNIAYAILIALMTIVLLLLHLALAALNHHDALHATAFLVYVMVINFILTLLMVLKRVHVLLGTEFNNLVGPHST